MNMGVELLKPEEVVLARSRAKAVLSLARTDETLVQGLRLNPAATLNSLGLPKTDASIVEAFAEGVVPVDCCNDFTCLSSGCPSTCYATVCYSTSIAD